MNLSKLLFSAIVYFVNYIIKFKISVYFLREYVGREMTWIWILWLVSQAWITMHTWAPHCERLAATDRLFVRPWYNGALIDQSLLLNRAKDDDTDIQYEVRNKFKIFY